MKWNDKPIEDKARVWGDKSLQELLIMESDLEKWYKSNPSRKQEYLERKERLKIFIGTVEWLFCLVEEHKILKGENNKPYEPSINEEP